MNSNPRLSRLISLGALALVLGSGCVHETSYRPTPNGRAHLVVKDGKLALEKNGSVFVAGGPMRSLTSCDREADDYATVGQNEITSGQQLQVLGSVLFLFVGTSPIAIALSAYGDHKVTTGNAAVIDALNRHNDAATCTTPNAASTQARN